MRNDEEIMHSDWLKLITWHSTSNQGAADSQRSLNKPFQLRNILAIAYQMFSLLRTSLLLIDTCLYCLGGLKSETRPVEQKNVGKKFCNCCSRSFFLQITPRNKDPLPPYVNKREREDIFAYKLHCLLHLLK